ncbi:MAG: hypothetical protein KDK91_09510 [Gammaproteobacteria bacterium]|nr:hypothetical protein [Gammaproteobacteria bacterium]
MPNNVKLVVSALVIVAGGALFLVDSAAGAGAWRYLSLVLVPLMIGAMWIFPEANAKGIRKQSAAMREDRRASH